MCKGYMIDAALLYIARLHLQTDEIVQVALRGSLSWCIVTSIDGETITGVVDDTASNGIARGSIVFFTRNQIIDIRDDLYVEKFNIEV